MFILISLNGGQLRHVLVNFDNLSDLRSFVNELKTRFKTKHGVYDAFPYARETLRGC